MSSYCITIRKKRGYWELKEEVIAGTVSRTGFGRCCASVTRQVRMNCKFTLCNYDVKKMELVGLTSALQGRKLEICSELLVEYYLLLDLL